MNVIIERLEIRMFIREVVGDISDIACDIAPSTVAFNNEREKLHYEKK